MHISNNKFGQIKMGITSSIMSVLGTQQCTHINVVFEVFGDRALIGD